MKRIDMSPRVAAMELRQAVQFVRSVAGMPAEDEEGYDPHVEHREYERMKAELNAVKKELERVRDQKNELAEALEEAEVRTVHVKKEADSMSWKRAIVLSEIIGPPRSRRK